MINSLQKNQASKLCQLTLLLIFFYCYWSSSGLNLQLSSRLTRTLHLREEGDASSPQILHREELTYCEGAKDECTREGAEEKRKNSPQILSLLLVQPHIQVLNAVHQTQVITASTSLVQAFPECLVLERVKCKLTMALLFPNFCENKFHVIPMSTLPMTLSLLNGVREAAGGSPTWQGDGRSLLLSPTALGRWGEQIELLFNSHERAPKGD